MRQLVSRLFDIARGLGGQAQAVETEDAKILIPNVAQMVIRLPNPSRKVAPPITPTAGAQESFFFSHQQFQVGADGGSVLNSGIFFGAGVWEISGQFQYTFFGATAAFGQVLLVDPDGNGQRIASFNTRATGGANALVVQSTPVRFILSTDREKPGTGWTWQLQNSAIAATETSAMTFNIQAAKMV